MSTALFERNANLLMSSAVQFARNERIAEPGDAMTLVTPPLHTFSPAHVCERVCGRVRTCILSKYSVTSVTSVTQQSKIAVTLAVTLSPVSLLVSPIRPCLKGGQP